MSTELVELREENAALKAQLEELRRDPRLVLTKEILIAADEAFIVQTLNYPGNHWYRDKLRAHGKAMLAAAGISFQ